MNKYLKRSLISFLLLLSLFGIARLYYHFTDDFRLSNITYSLPFEAPWKVPDLTAEEQQQLAQIFDQTFSYIGKGSQCYAFVSEDRQYVLKFFKFKHLKPSFLVDLLPSIPPFKDFKQSCAARKKHKLIKVFSGYDLAYRENRPYAELIYIHLLPTQHLHLQASLIDKIGLKRELPLDDFVFIVQRRGETLQDRLSQLLHQERVEEAKQALARILTMYLVEYKKGIFDRDHGVMINTGFVGDQPFRLDVGHLYKEEKMQQVEVYKHDFEHVIWKMAKWVKDTYPQYHADISHFLEQEYQYGTGEKLDLATIDSNRFKKQR